ncbi:protein adenylyltransferase SelO, mitochondrial-like isoform X2 [Biomphalaria glabrata]|nr:protein adenylyltransferase SelO, mitochondrial-like isoform X2 [Biomphalaria glabrata]XP_055859968.1 protein adenylyltransferase SelO, mitochondrial-like isoform X2 [Biomphalaria glabrata]
MAGLKPTLETLHFDNLALQLLPVDHSALVTQRQVHGACFSKVQPTPVVNPRTVCVSLSALNLLDIGESEMMRQEFVQYFSGNRILPGSETAAHCYCGHQFGYFSGQLGDGAAMYLGEILNEKGERWEIQLKGAGKTPYSRSADGRKVLRSSIREFLCSEAIHHLGIPTTRAGSCITSDSLVERDIYYNGNPKQEQCTIVLRIAPTFLRFGSFEIFKPVDNQTQYEGPSVGRTDILLTLLDYTIEHFYPLIWKQQWKKKREMYLEFYTEVVRRTARLVAEWQCVGWCHGVLNTDNMSIVGVTIDYGPFGFMDKYNPYFVCNASDDGGRYSYKKQPEICKWNCQKLAEAIQDAVPLSKTEPVLNLFDEEFDRHYTMKMRKKFGLKKEQTQDRELFNSFFETLERTAADFTNCFRYLSNFPLPGLSDYEEKKADVIKYFVSQSSTVAELKKVNRVRYENSQLMLYLMLAESRPEMIPNLRKVMPEIVQELNKMERLKELKDLTDESLSQKSFERWSAWFEKFALRLQLEKADVSDLNSLSEERKKIMNSVNPKFVLRNYIAQNAIAAAEKGDYSEVRKVLKLLETPYDDDVPDLNALELNGLMENESHTGQAGCHAQRIIYDEKPPEWAFDLRVT